MPSSPLRRERRERALKLLEDPSTFEEILQEVRSGITLVTACMERDIPHYVISRWMEESESRVVAYEVAKAERDRVIRDMVSGTLAELCQADISTAFYPDGSLRPLTEIPSDVRRAISSIDVEEIWAGKGEERRQVGVLKRVRFWDRLRALELTGRSQRMFVDRNELEIDRPITLAELLSADPPWRALPEAPKPALGEAADDSEIPENER